MIVIFTIIILLFAAWGIYFVFIRNIIEEAKINTSKQQLQTSQLPLNTDFQPKYYQPGEAEFEDVTSVAEFIADIPCEEILGLAEEEVIMGELYFPEPDSGKNIRALYCIEKEKYGIYDPKSINVVHNGQMGSYEVRVKNSTNQEPVKPSALLRSDINNQDLREKVLELYPDADI